MNSGQRKCRMFSLVIDRELRLSTSSHKEVGGLVLLVHKAMRLVVYEVMRFSVHDVPILHTKSSEHWFQLALFGTRHPAPRLTFKSRYGSILWEQHPCVS